MSDIVGGGISRGRGDEQVVLMFSGNLDKDQWAAFVDAVVQTAQQHNVAVRRFPPAADAPPQP